MNSSQSSVSESVLTSQHQPPATKQSLDNSQDSSSPSGSVHCSQSSASLTPVSIYCSQSSATLTPSSQQTSSSSSQPSSQSCRRHRSPDEKLASFLSKGCGCKFYKGGPCYRQFDATHFRDIQDQCNSLTKDELDLVLLGQIMANISCLDVVGPRSKHAPSPRQRSRILVFYHHGAKICRDTFLMLHGVGNDLSNNNKNTKT